MRRLRREKLFVPFVVGFMALGYAMGVFVTEIARPHMWPIDRAKAVCGYIPHGISDIAWEPVGRKEAPVGSAHYFTVMMNSDNQEPGNCMRDRLEPGWR